MRPVALYLTYRVQEAPSSVRRRFVDAASSVAVRVRVTVEAVVVLDADITTRGAAPSARVDKAAAAVAVFSDLADDPAAVVVEEIRSCRRRSSRGEH